MQTIKGNYKMKTLQILEILFPKTDKIDLKYVADLIDNRLALFGLNTPLRVAHFLAQVREEIGEEFKPISENLNYSEEALLNIFSVFKNNPDLAEKYGRDEDTPKANQVLIANYAYANRMGNGSADSNNDGVIDSLDDGYRYRGAGVLQITGKLNYEAVQKRIDRYLPNSGINILNGTDIHSLKGALLAGAGYWIWKDIYKQADLGTSEKAVDEVTAKINKHTDSYFKRRKWFNQIKHLIEE